MADPDVREAEHLPRLADAAAAPRDPYQGVDTVLGPADETLNLTGDEVTGDERRLDPDDVIEADDGDLSADVVPYFRYDPATGGVTEDPPPGARLEGGLLVVDD